MNAVSLRKRSGGLSGGDVRVEIALVFPDSPADAGYLVGEGAGRFVMADTRFQRARPLLKPCESLSCALQLLGSGQH